MKNTYIIFTLIASFLLVFSCSDLEEDRSGILSLDNLQSEGDLVAALTPVYKQLQVVYNGFRIRTNTFGSDDLTTWWGGNKAPLRVFDGFNYGNGENADINWLDYDWKEFWKLIYHSNSLIDGLKTSSAPDNLKAIIEGEARFLRAYSYLCLVKVYGNLPVILDGLTPTGEEQRATVLENYKHIEADLLFAESNLPAPGATANFGRASAAAAKTALADLYLTWAGWPVKDTSKNALAASKAKEVIDMGYYTLIPIDQLWLMENANSKESIFSVQYSKEEDQRNGMPAATSFHMARGWSDMYPELQFFRDFPEGPRKEATFVTDIPNRDFKGGKIVTKDPPTVRWDVSQRFHPMYGKWTASEDLTVAGRTMGYRAQEIYRYAEVLLIYAEAKAASGSMDATALEALNQVRRRAAGLDPNIADASVDVNTATIHEIVAEKGWELAGENKRWFDLIRTETLEDAIAKRDPNEQVPLVRQPTKAQYITPIPAEAIATSKLTQNPEGFKIQ
jgi:hypothetical protein